MSGIECDSGRLKSDVNFQLAILDSSQAGSLRHRKKGADLRSRVMVSINRLNSRALPCKQSFNIRVQWS